MRQAWIGFLFPQVHTKNITENSPLHLLRLRSHCSYQKQINLETPPQHLVVVVWASFIYSYPNATFLFLTVPPIVPPSQIPSAGESACKRNARSGGKNAQVACLLRDCRVLLKDSGYCLWALVYLLLLFSKTKQNNSIFPQKKNI